MTTVVVVGILGTGSAFGIGGTAVAKARHGHGSSSTHGKHPSSTTTSLPGAPRCDETHIAVKVDLTVTGKGSTGKAGAIVFTDTSAAPCSLVGVPTVGLIDSTGGAIESYEQKSISHHPTPVVLHPRVTGLGPVNGAGVSITWSYWTCATGAFSVSVSFPGWTHPLTVVPGGALLVGPSLFGVTCKDAVPTVYIGPVEKTP